MGSYDKSILKVIRMNMSSNSSFWRTLACSIKELRLEITLACGQSFRWKEAAKGEWTSVLHGKIWTLKQDENFIYYKVAEDTDNLQISGNELSVPTKNLKESQSKRKATKNAGDAASVWKEDQELEDSKTADYERTLRDYFQLQYSLSDLYKTWSQADPNFHEVASTFTGVRMLRQDPTENVFAFICSSNNHISRISGMVERLCETYGSVVGELDGREYYAFPVPEVLAQEGVESRLRQLGFGYRAKFINQSAKTICARGGVSWLHSLRKLPYEEAKGELMTLCGVGAKVADCVCLMSMDHLGAIPVDTHVWQIAARHYMTKLNSAKSLTPTIYKQIGDHFRELWGDLAGWAHSVLFSADLKKFKDLKAKPTVKDEPSEAKMTKNVDIGQDREENMASKTRKRSSKAKKPTNAKRIKK